MPPRARVIVLLSHQQRVELSRQIADQGFANYAEIAKTWQDKGFELTEQTVRTWADSLRKALLLKKVKDPSVALALQSLTARDEYAS